MRERIARRRDTLTGMADDRKQKYQALVERVRRYPMPEATRAAILAEIEEAYGRELAERRRDRRAAGDIPGDTSGISGSF